MHCIAKGNKKKRQTSHLNRHLVPFMMQAIIASSARSFILNYRQSGGEKVECRRVSIQEFAENDLR